MKYIATWMMSALCIMQVHAAFAAETITEESQRDIAGTLPTSMWYWVDILAEQWTLWTVSDEERPKVLAALMEEKTAEMALTLGAVKEAAQAGERYEIYFQDLAKTVDAGSAEEYQAFVTLTVDQLTQLSAMIEDAEQGEVPSFVYEIATTMSDTHRSLIQALDGDLKTQATNILMTSIETVSASALSTTTQQVISQFIQSVFAWVADFLQDQFTALSAQAQAYIRARADEYLDQAKQSVIDYIQSIELPQ